MVLKCADIGHLAAAPKVHKRWAYQLEEEFFRQVSSSMPQARQPMHLLAGLHDVIYPFRASLLGAAVLSI